tara:strand:- start:614 stop:1126 length:513 start_codon:yes stop_codon:yes gene_type:complete
MQDIKDIIKAVENVYDNDTAFTILKDFERVLDQLDLYVYDNWENGELVAGPEITRHFITCSFMWPREEMPDPMGGKRLTDYGCKVFFKKDVYIYPRKVLKQDDFRPGTKKGKLDQMPVWIVQIRMPKELIRTIYSGYEIEQDYNQEPANSEVVDDSTPVEKADNIAPEGI